MQESLDGSAGREVSSTMAMVRVLTMLLKHPELGKRVVPIIPDEARTFGMESLFLGASVRQARSDRDRRGQGLRERSSDREVTP